MVYVANALIVFDGFVAKTRPGAWEDEPPVVNSGPRSSTVTSMYPRAVSSSARAAPTTPAPITTTFGMNEPICELLLMTQRVVQCATHRPPAGARRQQEHAERSDPGNGL